MDANVELRKAAIPQVETIIQLHEPTSRLRMQASEGNGQGYAHAVRELFALNGLDAIECQQHESGCGLVEKDDQPTNQCTLQCILPMGQ